MGSIIPFPARPAAPPPAEAHPVRLEAQHWEHQYGRDAYSAFLLKHGRRPDPGQAEVLGKVVGRRVKASDGLRYPKINQTVRPNDDRKKWEKIKLLHKAMNQFDPERPKSAPSARPPPHPPL